MFLCRNIENYYILIIPVISFYLEYSTVKLALKVTGEDLLKAISCDNQVAYGYLCMDFKIIWHICSSGRLKVKVTPEGQTIKWS